MIPPAIETVITVLLLIAGAAVIGAILSIFDDIARRRAKREINDFFRKTKRRIV